MFTTPRTDQYFTPSNQYIYTLYHAYIIILPDHVTHLYHTLSLSTYPALSPLISNSPSPPDALALCVGATGGEGGLCVRQSKGVREGRAFKKRTILL